MNAHNDNGQWPECERYTYRPGRGGGRCWVCTPPEEELCAKCVETQALRARQEKADNAAHKVDQAERDSSPYHIGMEKFLPELAAAVADCGSAEALLDDLRVNGVGDFRFWVPHLLAWNLPEHEACNRWFSLLEEARRF